MRLLALAAAYPSPRAPYRARYLEDLHAALVEAAGGRWTLEVVAPRTHPGDPAEEWRAGIRVLRFDWGARGKRLKEGTSSPLRVLAWLRAARRRLLAAARESPAPDLLLAHWVLPSAPVVAPVARRLRLPWAAWAHGSDVHTYARRGPGRWLARRALRSAGRVFAVSRELAEELRDGLGVPASRITVLPMGVAPAFHPAPRAVAVPGGARASGGEGPRASGGGGEPAAARPGAVRPLELLLIGDLVPEKGVGDLLRALDLLRERGVSVRLAAAGEGPLGPELARRAEPGGAGDVRILGLQPPGRLAEALRSADVLVHPSRAEGAPLAVLEALACGTPVVACAVGGVPELVTGGVDGLLVPPRDPEALARAIESLARDRGRLAELREALRASPPDHAAASRARIALPRLEEAAGGAG